MFKSLRRKFVATSVASVAVVIILMASTLNFINYYKMGQRVDDSLYEASKSSALVTISSDGEQDMIVTKNTASKTPNNNGFSIAKIDENKNVIRSYRDDVLIKGKDDLQKLVTEALKEGTEVDPATLGKDGVKYQNSVDFIKNGDAKGVGDYLQQGGPKSAYGIAKEMIDNEEYIKDAMWGPSTETLLKSGSTLDDILTEGFTKIIVGEKDIDFFDTLVADWEKAGGEKATEEINTTYGNK